MIDFGRPNMKKKTCTLMIHILNPSHHVRDNSPASFELLGDHIRSGAMTWNGNLSLLERQSLLSFIRNGLKMS